MRNQAEHAAGTDPKDRNSALRILTLVVQTQPPQALLGWQSASSRSYIIETAPAPEGPWSDLGAAVPSAGAATQTSINLATGESNRFYRVRLAPQ